MLLQTVIGYHGHIPGRFFASWAHIDLTEAFATGRNPDPKIEPTDAEPEAERDGSARWKKKEELQASAGILRIRNLAERRKWLRIDIDGLLALDPSCVLLSTLSGRGSEWSICIQMTYATLLQRAPPGSGVIHPSQASSSCVQYDAQPSPLATCD